MVEARRFGLQLGERIKRDLVPAGTVRMDMQLEARLPPRPHGGNEGVLAVEHEQALVAVIAWAHANGIDAEAALRKEAMRISREIGPA